MKGCIGNAWRYLRNPGKGCGRACGVQIIVFFISRPTCVARAFCDQVIDCQYIAMSMFSASLWLNEELWRRWEHSESGLSRCKSQTTRQVFHFPKPNTKCSRRLMRPKGEYENEYPRSNRWWTTSLLQIADNIFDRSSLTNTKFIRVFFSDTKLVSWRYTYVDS